MKTTAQDKYLAGRVNFGGALTKRSDVIAQMTAEGFSSQHIDHWMIGADRDARTQPSYYVSVEDAGRHRFLLGPYTTHDEALANVDRANRAACELDPRAHFYGYGTCLAPDGWTEGILNSRIGLVESIAA